MYVARRCDVTPEKIAMTPLSTHLDFQLGHIYLWGFPQAWPARVLSDAGRVTGTAVPAAPAY